MITNDPNTNLIEAMKEASKEENEAKEEKG